MAKLISNIIRGVEQVKRNYGYFKAGVREEKKEYAKLQRIKNTPENFRSKEDTEYARSKNKTK